MIRSKQAACHSSRTAGWIRAQALLWIAFALWLVTLFVLSSIPGSRFGPLPFDWADKAVHALIFMAGSFLLASGFHHSLGPAFLKILLLAFVIMVLIGAGDELHQVYTPGRSGNDRGDLLADAVGALLGAACAGLLHAKRSAKPPLPAPGTDRAA